MNRSRFRLAIGVLITILIVILIVERLLSVEPASHPPIEVTATLVNTAIAPTPSLESASVHPFENIQLAWFYKPPEK